jgi:hypothetical protein
MVFRLKTKLHGPGLLLIGESVRDFESFSRLLSVLAADFPRISIVLCAADKAVREGLCSLFPHTLVSDLPLGVPGVVDLFLSRAMTRTIVVPRLDFNLPSGLTAAIDRRRINVVCVHPSGKDFSCSEVRQNIAANDQEQTTASVSTTSKLLAKHVGRERQLRSFNGESSKLSPNYLLSEFLASASIHRKLSRFFRRIDGVNGLSERLNRPQTIMCLGNGPSSEDPRLMEHGHDVLFRTNHAWMGRGFLTHPDVVITGLRTSMRKVRGAIFGIYGQSWERVFHMQRGLKLLRDPAEYFLTDHFGQNKQERNQENHWPTAGAIMISVAVDLQPSKLIIAGIDMFQHEKGAYPEDKATPNDFAPAHSFDCDKNHIMQSLARYEGELVILSEVLRANWHGHKAQMKKNSTGRPAFSGS